MNKNKDNMINDMNKQDLFNKKNSIKKQLTQILTDNIIVFLLACLALYVGFTRDNFFTWANFMNIISNITPRFIIALGVSGCLITRGTDLSAGRAVGLAGVVACTLLQRPDYSDKFFKTFSLPENVGVVIGVALFVIFLSMLFGLADGIIISFLKVPPFLATLGMQMVIYGIACVYTDARPIGGLRTDFTSVATAPLIKIGTLNIKGTSNK